MTHEPTLDIYLNPIDDLVEVTCEDSFGEGFQFWRGSRGEAHYDALRLLEDDGYIPKWTRDIVSFPLHRHPFLTGKEKFDAMLEVEHVVSNVDNFLTTGYGDIR